MRGIGGPLLCIGDLLNDVGEEEDAVVADSHCHRPESQPSSPSVSALNDTLPNSDLTKLFQENYEHLNEALAGTDHSWTALTLKLCTSLETANQLVQYTNSNVTLLSEKVGELQKIVKRGDSAVATAKTTLVTPETRLRGPLVLIVDQDTNACVVITKENICLASEPNFKQVSMRTIRKVTDEAGTYEHADST